VAILKNAPVRVIARISIIPNPDMRTIHREAIAGYFAKYLGNVIILARCELLDKQTI
jgi:hypothetical protein